MCSSVIISLFMYLLMYSNAVYLAEQANYYKPRLERNNILNKGLWMKDKIEKSNYGNFIFRADSGDVDNLLQNNLDAFGDSYMNAIPVFSTYVERNKRSIINKQSQRLKKSVKKCKDKKNCPKNEKPLLYKSKFISQLRPASVFNDYPYEVAVLLANSNKRAIKNVEKSKAHIDNNKNETDDNLSKTAKESNLNDYNKTELNDLKLLDKNITVSINETTAIVPKRRMANLELDLEHKDKLVIETNNETEHVDGNKISRNVFDKEERMWQNAPIQNMAVPRPESSLKNKPVTEKGLVKILSLLTKTFRKVMKQHNEIQEIDNKLHGLNEEFMKNVGIIETKFQGFDIKYHHLLEINEEMERLNEKFTKKNDDIEQREIELAKNMKEFENQQKKFLSQQHQFYTIQKFMLEQNEKINRKQSLITKTQSEISHRQNNFARVLKKAKQFYMDKKNMNGSKLSPTYNNLINSSTVKDDKDPNNISLTPSNTPVSTDSVKINLFSIPNIGPLRNHDKLILDEKNEQSVDDLVYKYYFNNTFIDNIMKSKVLTAVVDNEAKSTRNTKNKRNDLINETTILLPVGKRNEFSNQQSLHRERRWIRHSNKISKKHQDKEAAINEKMGKNLKDNNIKINKDKNDPFLAMAINFCKEVGQHQNDQMLKWCVEKSLRKLKSIDMIFPANPLATPPVKNIPKTKVPTRNMKDNSVSETTKLFPRTTLLQAAEPTISPSSPVISSPVTVTTLTENAVTTEKTTDIFFPDNDELESNLKQYELKPDTEGTVYFDGSLHTSDIVLSESEALSDIMPGLDSNSRVDVDPLTLDMQARRRAFVHRLNQNILKKIKA